ncbi:hypothetical protein DFH09DRAFT_1356694 [Mycena vulgaris]|nr:hypothetical protein DFH09DRAFT_1356694 [Mycena vulgaris]
MDGIPSDVLDTIIDLVSIDQNPQGLHTCSLVCRAWLPRTRDQLFGRRRVSVTFMELLAADRCTFAPHVRELRFQLRSDNPDDKLYEHDPGLLRRLTGVHSLQLYILRPLLSNDVARFPNVFLAHFLHVTHLEICGASLAPENFVADTIGMFPLLTQLIISAYATGASPGLPFVAPKNLRHLTLSNCGMSVLSGFCDSGGLRNIHSLELPHIRPESEAVVAAAFRALARSLTCLHLHFSGSETAAVDISPLVNLQSFRVDLSPWGTAAPYQGVLACVFRLSSNSLETFSCRVPARGRHLLDWQALDAFLISDRFPGLKRFYWEIYGFPFTDEDSQRVLDNLPRLTKSAVIVTRSYFY